MQDKAAWRKAALSEIMAGHTPVIAGLIEDLDDTLLGTMRRKADQLRLQANRLEDDADALRRRAVALEEAACTEVDRIQDSWLVRRAG